MCRDLFQPVFEIPFLSVWITDMLWMSEPSGIVFCQDDGNLKAVEITSLRRPDSMVPAERKQHTYWYAPCVSAIPYCFGSALSVPALVSAVTFPSCT